MDVRGKLVELSDIQVLQREIECVKRKSSTNCTDCLNCDLLMPDERILTAYKNAIDALQNEQGVTVQEWINSEEMLPEFPCLAIDVNGKSVFIPDGILTIKDKHGEWCIDASLAKEVRLIDGTKIDALIWENRIAYWMPFPHPPKGE